MHIRTAPRNYVLSYALVFFIFIYVYCKKSSPHETMKVQQNHISMCNVDLYIEY